MKNHRQISNKSLSKKGLLIIVVTICSAILFIFVAKELLQNHHAIRIPEPSPVAKKYADLTVIDVHNHDAAGARYKYSIKLWDAYGIDRVVLFAGSITDPRAVEQDEIAWKASQEYPERILPFFTGFDVNSKDSLVYVREHIMPSIRRKISNICLNNERSS
ncbi:MAG: hypothetical protein JXM70_16440 [Pirellulales bacterium]|nr:hypothetical protein [Pirellulales bacterium]